MDDADTGIFNLGTCVGDALRRGKLILPPLLPGDEGAPQTGRVSLIVDTSLYLGSTKFKVTGFATEVIATAPPLEVWLFPLVGGTTGRRREFRLVIGGLAAAVEGDGDLDLCPKLVEPLLGGGEAMKFGEGLLDRVSNDVDL